MTTPEHGIIRRARLEDVDALNALTGRSVLSWGYEPAFLEWEPEAITVLPEHIARDPVFVLEEGGRLAGYYALSGAPPEIVLDKLFIAPERLRSGYGTRLWRHAVETARALGATTMTLASDPNAAPFYAAMGAEWVRAQPTSWPGWELQMFRFSIPEDPAPSAPPSG